MEGPREEFHGSVSQVSAWTTDKKFRIRHQKPQELHQGPERSSGDPVEPVLAGGFALSPAKLGPDGQRGDHHPDDDGTGS